MSRARLVHIGDVINLCESKAKTRNRNRGKGKKKRNAGQKKQRTNNKIIIKHVRNAKRTGE